MSTELKRGRSVDEYEAPELDEDDEAAEAGEPNSKKSKMTVDDDDDEAGDDGTGYKPSIDLSIGGDAAWRRPTLASINPATDTISKKKMETENRGLVRRRWEIVYST